jgi:hypothetical protein
MRRVDAILRLALAGLVGLSLAACETTWRRSTFHHVVLDGREIAVSWIRLQPDEIEVVAWEPLTFEGVQPPEYVRLDRVTAARAAETVVAQVCSDRFAAETVAGTYAEGHHAFRYRCLADDR